MERTQQHPEQPTPTPRPNRILAQPATPAACAADYEAAANIRARLNQQNAAGKH